MSWPQCLAYFGDEDWATFAWNEAIDNGLYRLLPFPQARIPTTL
jgi:hypothetical protein